MFHFHGSVLLFAKWNIQTNSVQNSKIERAKRKDREGDIDIDDDRSYPIKGIPIFGRIIDQYKKIFIEISR